MGAFTPRFSAVRVSGDEQALNSTHLWPAIVPLTLAPEVHRSPEILSASKK
jgi:hypothetical protein